MQIVAFRRSTVVPRRITGETGNVSVYSRTGAEFRYSSTRGPREDRHHRSPWNYDGAVAIHCAADCAPMNTVEIRVKNFHRSHLFLFG